ncbi:LysR substrate-binding domain-containing protein [Novosphingobium beihaiensis]|uniref:LysR substrate-binding domain-containing protein n=1 Tax=Novosphingobium beihaiensis TaxID=2930389 RepID=A0ABT0BK35_9SPHN|nr:LysR substrate-binding domain-containing protein [Novosphingobium beihaiensis]MCJ2185407.1 LysR substrate-binding domain-containing protein [Novosphingobium beihaiensis]
MDIRALSLNTLRAFEASARHLNFTRAADELCVTQAAVSQQVKTLESHVGKPLFRRTTRGLVLSDEGTVLAPVVSDALGRMSAALAVVAGGNVREILTVGAVGTFALSFLMERLPDFQTAHPGIEVRLQTNNNAVDLWTESLDLAIRFGDGSWHGVAAEPLMPAPMTPMCSPALANRIMQASDLAHVTLLRSYRLQDWPAWFAAAHVRNAVARGPIFDASHLMATAAIRGMGVALLPIAMFQRELESGLLAAPFDLAVDRGSYWLTRLSSRPQTAAMRAFSEWLTGLARESG